MTWLCVVYSFISLPITKHISSVEKKNVRVCVHHSDSVDSTMKWRPSLNHIRFAITARWIIWSWSFEKDPDLVLRFTYIFLLHIWAITPMETHVWCHCLDSYHIFFTDVIHFCAGHSELHWRGGLSGLIWCHHFSRR
jgi:hypothetical protein